MARVTLTRQSITHAGSALTYTPPTGSGANNGWTFNNNGENIVEFKNTDSSSKTLTLKANGQAVGGIALPDKTVTVPAAVSSVPGVAKVKLPTSYFGATAQVDTSDATGVTAALYQ